jgi:hypothetical protein
MPPFNLRWNLAEHYIENLVGLIHRLCDGCASRDDAHVHLFLLGQPQPAMLQARSRLGNDWAEDVRIRVKHEEV